MQAKSCSIGFIIEMSTSDFFSNFRQKQEEFDKSQTVAYPILLQGTVLIGWWWVVRRWWESHQSLAHTSAARVQNPAQPPDQAPSPSYNSCSPRRLTSTFRRWKWLQGRWQVRVKPSGWTIATPIRRTTSLILSGSGARNRWVLQAAVAGRSGGTGSVGRYPPVNVARRG